MKKSLLLILLTPLTWAGDNHVHVEQVASGDVDLNITQAGYDNEIKFSFAHSGNTFNLLQTGNGNSISWVSYWGPGKSWGGDVDGINNTENVEQSGGATYGRHIWGNSNTVDVYQNGSHTHNIHTLTSMEVQQVQIVVSCRRVQEIIMHKLLYRVHIQQHLTFYKKVQQTKHIHSPKTASQQVVVQYRSLNNEFRMSPTYRVGR